jgi:CPA2 family monovalent cation:H+ antiporter-2
MLAGWYFGLPPKTAFVTAGALALSSTAVVLKQLAEQHELHTVHGRLSVAILLFQDLAAVLFLILIPALAGDNESSLAIPILYALFKGIGVCIFLGIFGKYLLRPLFHEVVKSHSSELFMLAALMVVLGAAWLTHYLELSMALGAFLAGLMLGETSN